MTRAAAIEELLRLSEGRLTRQGAATCIDMGADFWRSYNTATGMMVAESD